MSKSISRRIRRQEFLVLRTGGLLLAVWLSLFWPAVAFANEAVNANGNPTGPSEPTGPSDPTGPSEPTGAPACTGAGCHQGEDQGIDQGAGQGGPTAEELGAYTDEQGAMQLPEGVIDTRQGAQQGYGVGYSQGASNGLTTSSDLSGTNSNTGAGSTNAVESEVSLGNTTGISNTVNDSSQVDASANTGNNTNSRNTNSGPTATGNAGIGVTQVKQDNTASVNGGVDFASHGYNGDHVGDLSIEFENAVDLLTSSGLSRSVQAINDTTGEGSSNDILLSTRFEDVTEVQNDGEITNSLTLEANTGENESNMNTGNGSITTGDANIAATLVNLLNTTVINGNILVVVQDIFGDLIGNILLPDFSQLASVLASGSVQITADNDGTGNDSTNNIDIDVTDEEITSIQNDAEISTHVTAEAITGQNETLKNTGGGQIDTGDASVSASSISVANTTIEGGSWGLIVVNALNRWIGFLVGDAGYVRQLSSDETIREIEARNSGTGADSDNNIDITDETRRTTTVTNDAVITNDVNASAVTGRNTASKNTGGGRIHTGKANIATTALNIANTTVKDAFLGVAIVNIFGDWIGNLLYGGSSLLASASNLSADVDAGNRLTGADSENDVSVDITRSQETIVHNNADITTTLETTIDTGHNKASSNTLGGDVETGNGLVALHARSIANLSGIAGHGSLAFQIEGENDTTGVSSENSIRAHINDERVVTVTNDANVSTILPGSVNTGHNEANKNTIGGAIDTGRIDASVAVSNLVNRTLLALGDDISFASDELSTLVSEFLNRRTGAGSLNESIVDLARRLLATITNDADIDNIIDMLFNTGSNESLQNTSPYVSGGTAYASAQQYAGNSADSYSDADVNSQPLTAYAPASTSETSKSTETSPASIVGGNDGNEDSPVQGDRHVLASQDEGSDSGLLYESYEDHSETLALAPRNSTLLGTFQVASDPVEPSTVSPQQVLVRSSFRGREQVPAPFVDAILSEPSAGTLVTPLNAIIAFIVAVLALGSASWVLSPHRGGASHR